MNHRFTNEESAFAVENIAGGQEILDKEQDLSKRTTCVNVKTAVLVLESIATSYAVVLILSLMFATATGSATHFPIMLTQLVTASVAHLLALLAVYHSLSSFLYIAVALNLVEVILNISRMCLILKSGEL